VSSSERTRVSASGSDGGRGAALAVALSSERTGVSARARSASGSDGGRGAALAVALSSERTQ
jgi:hypothetical protein